MRGNTRNGHLNTPPPTNSSSTPRDPGGHSGGTRGGTHIVPILGAGQQPVGTQPPGATWIPFVGWSVPSAPSMPDPGTGSGGTGTGTGGGMSSDQQSAFGSLNALLKEYGLTALAGQVKQWILDGTTDSSTLMLNLQQTNEWKQRFAGNEMLAAQGLGVLSPAEYLATERSYAQVMKNYGLPSGFYDDPADFAKWIGNNVSAAELQSRVGMYADLANREDPAIVQQLKSMGMGQGELLAYMIDPSRATPLIQKQYQTALIGGAARRAGLSGMDNNYLGQLAGQGVTEQQASQGFGQIAGSLADANSLASVYGEKYGLKDMEAEVFQNDGKAANKRKRLASQERASFSGTAGTGPLGGNTSGTY